MSVRYSHPPVDGHDGVELSDHLEDVAERVRYVVPADAQTPAGESLRAVVETLAYVHDFGKATTFFQDYLLRSQPPQFEQYRYHAPIGSFAAYYALDAQGFEIETCLAGFVAVAKHHGKLPDVAKYVFERAHRRDNVSRGNESSTEMQQTAIRLQIKDINDEVPTLAETVFQNATAGEGSWALFKQRFVGGLLNEIASAVGTVGSSATVSREALSDSCYGLVLECWGALVLADKTSAAEAATGRTASSQTYEAAVPSQQRLESYINKLERSVTADLDGDRDERLNHSRSRARTDVLENAKRFADDGGGVATLTLPTGMGKTLTGLSAALAVRDGIGGSRVVYALPFTSIIDQVVDELEAIYETDTTGRLLTAHHHLSETTIVDDDRDVDDADKNDDVAGMLAESWRAGVTVTTFVQLFESLAGPANRQSMKLPALRNSVVVLDEPQSLPLDWWKLVPRLVRMLTDQYDATVIAMTATQPRLFDTETELVDEPETYFRATERVQYELDVSTERYIEAQDGPKSYDTAAAELRDALDAGASALAICNTIDSAQELTEQITELLPAATSVGEAYAAELDAVGDVANLEAEVLADRIMDAGDQSILHLSTRLRPVDRLRLIETAKRLTKQEHPLVTVSTQLVEAGVDISFDRVYRDLAPVDSIVQAAGRCNRSFERKQGTVTVWWLDAPSDQTKTPAEAVYNRGATLLPVAAKTLDDVRATDGTLSEFAVASTAVKQYYQRLHDEKNVGKQSYAEYVDAAKADELARLSLIEQRLSVDVVVCRTEEEYQRVEAIRTAWENYDFETVRQLLNELKKTMVSIPIYRTDSKEAQALSGLARLHGDTEIRWIDTREPRHDSYFDATTGLVAESTVENRFL